VVISGVLVITRPEHQAELRTTLGALSGVDVHHADPDGRLVITVEASTTEEAMARLRDIQQLPHVALAEMAEHYVGEDA
jgi:nitrate reductase NapD